MKCAKAQELFSGYLENTIQPPMGVALEQHLTECPRCRAEYDRFHATTLLLDELPEAEPPADFHAAIMARVERTRSTAPRNVRWWHLDWQSVFTVRVPARAVAMGAAVLLVFALLVQLTPLHMIAANMLFGQRATKNMPYGDDSGIAPAPLPFGAKTDVATKYMAVGPGLSVGVRVDSNNAQVNVCRVRFETWSDAPVSLQAYLLPDSALSDGLDTKDFGNLQYSGSISKGQGATVKIYTAEPGSTSRVRMAAAVWTYEGRTYNELAFIPTKLNSPEIGVGVSASNVSLYDVLAKLSAEYGIVILVPGNAGDRMVSVNTGTGNASVVMAAAMQQANMKWRQAGKSVYVVGAQ